MMFAKERDAQQLSTALCAEICVFFGRSLTAEDMYSAYIAAYSVGELYKKLLLDKHGFKVNEP